MIFRIKAPRSISFSIAASLLWNHPSTLATLDLVTRPKQGKPISCYVVNPLQSRRGKHPIETRKIEFAVFVYK